MTRTAGLAPAAGDSLERTLRALPKVELHLHLEGTIRPRTVQELAAKYEPRSPLTAPDWHERYWTFTDLAGFVTQMRQVSLTCLRNPDDYYRLAAECFADLAAQHVCYAEVMFGFRGPEAPYPIPYPDLVAAIKQARREAEARSPLRIGLLPSLIRTQPDSAVPLLRQALAARERGAAIVGIDLVGDEAAGQDFAALAPAYRLAGEAGLGLSAHAGEAAGPESCWGALRLLGARRLGHATRAGADPALVARLRSERITLTMCPTSNLRTGAGLHPGRPSDSGISSAGAGRDGQLGRPHALRSDADRRISPAGAASGLLVSRLTAADAERGRGCLSTGGRAGGAACRGAARLVGGAPGVAAAQVASGRGHGERRRRSTTQGAPPRAARHWCCATGS